MKSKRRHHTSSDDSDESDASANSTSSGNDSGHSSLSEQLYNTKKRKRVDSSDSDSDSDEQKRSQKRKQKKKKHGNKNKRSDSVTGTVSVPVTAPSEAEISSKNKRKHKRQRSSSVSAKDEKQIQRRLHSVVVKRRGSCEESNHRSPKEEYQRRPREQEGRYHQREDTRGFNRYNQHKERGGRKKRELEDRRYYREARGPPDNYRLLERELPERKERYHDEGFASKRPCKIHREKSHHKCGFADTDENKEYDWGKRDLKTKAGKDPAEKEKPNFGLSGKLTAEANTVNGVVIKYTEPDDAKLPKRRWRLLPFKGDKALTIINIHRQSSFLIGRNKKVVDITLENPSISKQHAALQYRAISFTRPDGTQGRRVRPYVIDLESANGTFVNRKKLEPRRYVELLEQDVIKFGFSQREYVLLHENSKYEAQDDEQPGASRHRRS